MNRKAVDATDVIGKENTHTQRKLQLEQLTSEVMRDMAQRGIKHKRNFAVLAASDINGFSHDIYTSPPQKKSNGSRANCSVALEITKTSDFHTNFLVLDQTYGDVFNVRGTLIDTNGPAHSVHEIHFRCRKITRNIHNRTKITLAGARGTLYHLYILFANSQR